MIFDPLKPPSFLRTLWQTKKGTCLAAAHALLFQAGWFVCVLGKGWWGAAAAALFLMGYQGLYSPTRRAWIYVFSVGAMGILVDSSLHQLGVFEFQDQASFLIQHHKRNIREHGSSNAPYSRS